MPTLLALLVVISVLQAPPPQLKDTTPLTSQDAAFRKLAAPCPERVHINEPLFVDEEGRLFMYRPFDMYDDCADEMDELARTRDAIDDRLLEMGNKGKTLPERYRAAWVLIQCRNTKVVPILDKMAKSPSAEERYLTWHLYTAAIYKKQLAVPQSFDTALAQCKSEKNRFVRSNIMDFLGACRAKEAVPLLTAALKEDREYSAVSALGEIRDPKTVPAIIARAKKETYNRHIYFAALGTIGSPDAVDYLLEHLEESCFAVEALFESGSPKALPAIEKHLEWLKKEKPSDDLALAIAQISVLRLKHKDPREHLIALAEDRKQSRWMRTHALEALGHYDKKPLTARVLKLYRTDADDSTRMFHIRFLRDLPGEDITEAMIDQAHTDKKDVYHHSHHDLVEALNQRLNTSFRKMEPLVEYLRRDQAPKK